MSLHGRGRVISYGVEKFGTVAVLDHANNQGSTTRDRVQTERSTVGVWPKFGDFRR